LRVSSSDVRVLRHIFVIQPCSPFMVITPHSMHISTFCLIRALYAFPLLDPIPISKLAPPIIFIRHSLCTLLFASPRHPQSTPPIMTQYPSTYLISLPRLPCCPWLCFHSSSLRNANTSLSLVIHRRCFQSSVAASPPLCFSSAPKSFLPSLSRFSAPTCAVTQFPPRVFTVAFVSLSYSVPYLRHPLTGPNPPQVTVVYQFCVHL